MTRPDVEVSVLGPVAVSGAARPFRRAASLELVVFLAFHRRGARHAACGSALWPERPVSPATVHSTASDARRALGDAPDGSAHLPRGSELRLRATVTTDVERFAALAASGEADALVRAMGLVRGPLFAGLWRTDWAVFDGTTAAVEGLVVQAALHAARVLAHRGEADTAEWVVRRALAFSPYDERLYRALLRATAAQGDRVRLRSTMAQLRILAAGDPLGAPEPVGRHEATAMFHPRTTDLYRELRCGEPAAGGHSARL